MVEKIRVAEPKRTLVTERKGHLIVAGPGRWEVARIVHGSRQIVYKGLPMTVVKRTPQVTRFLENIKADVESDISATYHWPGPWEKPFFHQIKTAEFLVAHERAFCFNGTGTGKTASALWAFDYLRKIGKAKRVLIVSPLSTITSVWYNECFKVLPHLSCTVIHGPKKKRDKLLALKTDIVVTNHHGMKTMYEQLMQEDFDLVIVDEASILRNANTDLFDCAFDLTQRRRTWLLTATPTPKGPENAYGLALIVDPSKVPPSFNVWRAKVMLKLHTFTYVPRANWKQMVFDVLQPAIRVRKEDCLDLPPVTGPVVIESALSSEQKKLIKKVQSDMRAELKKGDIEVVNKAAELTKIAQLAQGAVITKKPDGTFTTEVVDAGPRLKDLMEIIENTDGKIIVYCPYRAVTEMVYRHVLGTTTAAMVHGGVNANKRTKIFDDFQFNPKVDVPVGIKKEDRDAWIIANDDSPNVLVAHPATVAHGLTLTSATATIWYGPPSGDSEVYEQANARMNRAGQTKPMTLYHMGNTTPEKALYRIVTGDEINQAELLDMYKQIAKGGL